MMIILYVWELSSQRGQQNEEDDRDKIPPEKEGDRGKKPAEEEDDRDKIVPEEEGDRGKIPAEEEDDRGKIPSKRENDRGIVPYRENDHGRNLSSRRKNAEKLSDIQLEHNDREEEGYQPYPSMGYFDDWFDNVSPGHVTLSFMYFAFSSKRVY